MRVGRCSVCWMYSIAFDPRVNWEGLPQKTEGSERLSNLPKVTQLVSGGLGIQIQGSG